MAFGACNSCRIAKTKCDRVSPQCSFCQRHNYTCHYKDKVRIVPCASCQKRKKKCDQAKPICGSCLARGDKCVYLNSTDSKSPKSGDSPDLAILLLKKNEKSIDILNSLTLFKKAQLLRKFYYDQKSCQLVHFSGRVINNLSPLLFLRDLFGALNSGDKVSFEDIISVEGLDLSIMFSQTRNFLITRSLVLFLVDLYFKSLNPFHPVLDRKEFYYLINNKYEDDNTQLLLYSVCLAGCSYFPDKRLCPSMTYAFADSIYNLLRKCYSTPNLLLLQAYSILALIPITDINHPKAKPQRFYHSQSILLLYLLGLHVPSRPRFLSKSTLRLRDILLYSNILGDNLTMSSSITQGNAKLRNLIDGTIFLQFSDYISGTKTFSSDIEQKLSVLSAMPRQLVFLNFLVFFYDILVFFQTQDCKSTDSREARTCELPSGFQNSEKHFVSLELKLHQAFLTCINVDSPGYEGNILIQIPELPDNLHNYVIYLCCLIDIYRPIINVQKSKVYLESLDTKFREVTLEYFMTLSPEAKCLVATLFISHILFKFKAYFISTGLIYKWWRITNIVLFLKYFINQLGEDSPLTPILTQTKENIESIFVIGKNRCEAAQLSYFLTVHQKKSDVHKISITPKGS